ALMLRTSRPPLYGIYGAATSLPRFALVTSAGSGEPAHGNESGSGEPAAPRRQSLLRSQARYALLPAATPRVRADRARGALPPMRLPTLLAHQRWRVNAARASTLLAHQRSRVNAAGASRSVARVA